ncbi:hypothetical protein IKF27_01285 [Candidatus Saccharibacteria bacterium]|nr:hypothetical protein [Candidatus Saccharibacteria bacterium]
MKEKKPLNPLIIVATIIVLGSLAVFLLLYFLSGSNDPSERDLEAEAGKASISQGEKEREEYPLLKNLPIKNAVYTIGYQFEDDGKPTIIITATEYYQPFALEKLNSLGDTSGYRIVVRDVAE